MADFQIHGRMLVKTLKEQFFNEFGGVLRVYNGKSEADPNSTLAAIRSNDAAKGGDLTCRASRTVGKFEQEMWEVFGIKVQVATKDDWVLVLDGITLNTIKDIPEKAIRKDMEQFVAYKREAKPADEPAEEPKAEAAKEEEEADYSDVLEILEGECLAYIPFYSDEEYEKRGAVGVPEFDKNWREKPWRLDDLYCIYPFMEDDGDYDWKPVDEIDYSKDGFYYAYDPEIDLYAHKGLGVYVVDGKIACVLFKDENDDVKIRIGNQVYERYFWEQE